MKKQAGFTLIELVMVIVILGILAAVALPKFVNLGSDARAAAMKGVEGSMRSANSIIYAKANIGNTMGANVATIVAGQGITTSYGFAIDVTNLSKAMDLSPDFVTATNVIYHQGAVDNTTCRVSYAAPTSVSTVPTYNTSVGGC